MPSLHTTDKTETVKFFVGHDTGIDLSKHSAFLSFYEEIAYLQAAEDDFCNIGPILGTHERIRELVQKLRQNPAFTKESFQQLIRRNVEFPEDVIEYAVRTVIRTGFMLDCILTKNFSKIFCLRNYVPQQWKPTTSFEDFIKSSIPKQDNGTLAPYEYGARISAFELRDRCGIFIQRTDNIADHLLYNPVDRTLKIFHQIGYLRAQLNRFPAPITATNLAACLNAGSLPPQLILETIESFYGLLFPVVLTQDGPSLRLLKQLVDRDGFDPASLVDIEDHSDWIPEDDFSYQYWGPRLQKLYEVSQDPIMNTRWFSWMDRYTDGQSALILAVAGLLLSAIFGFLGFVVGLAQLVIAVDAWKTPVSPPVANIS